MGTCDQAQALFDNAVRERAINASIVVASNPEFLAEGRAIDDFRHPARIVIGSTDRRSMDMLMRLYAPFDPTGQCRIAMDLHSAEFSKYACNAMLATRVSVVNELSCIAARVGADVESMLHVLGTDPRIGPRYLKPGAGYGGSCLPKDIKVLIGMARHRGEPAHMLRSAERVNRRQVNLLVQAICAHLGGNAAGHHVAVWGLAFKPGTDDIRAAPSLSLIRALLAQGAVVQAYDPVAGAAARAVVDDPALVLADTALQACEGADVLAVMTDWDEFKAPDFAALSMQLAPRRS